MAPSDQAATAKSIAAEVLRHVARVHPDVDAATAWQALVLAAADLREISRARDQERRWADAVPPSASANPWQVDVD